MLSLLLCVSFKGVDHPCERCGTVVEDGRPFCPQCRAPQVRVEVEPAPLPAEAIPSSQASAFDPLLQLSAPPFSSNLVFRVALQAGLLGVVANIIPFGLGMVLTGILAVLLYYRAGGVPLPAARIARLGAMAGAIAFAATSLFTVLIVVLANKQNEIRDTMMKAMDQRVANPSDPEVQAALRWLHSPEGFAVVLAFSMVLALLLSMLLSAVGSVLSSGLLRDRIRPRV